MIRNKALLFWSLVCCSLFIYLQCNYKFLFYYEEQLQLFLFTQRYAFDTIGQIGGLSLYVSRFLTQFFLIPYLGAGIACLLLTGIGLVVQSILRRMDGNIKDAYILYVLPSLGLLIMHLDVNYALQGTLAYLFMVVALYAYVCIRSWQKRFVTGWVLLLLLYVLAGPVATLFVCIVVLWEMLHKQGWWYLFFLFIGGISCLAFLSIRFSYIGEYRLALAPDAYYDPLLRAGKLYWSWVALPCCLFAALYLQGKKTLSAKAGWIVYTVGLFLTGGLVYALDSHYRYDQVTAYNIEQDYYERNGDWDKVIATFPSNDYNLQTVNVLNMSLARKGILGDALFGYMPRSRDYLLSTCDNTVSNAMSLSDVYFTVGDIASTQKMAFEGYIASINGGNARLLQRLTETHLIFGDYPVAEKYIRMLEQTLFYKEWASDHRRFLYNDKEVEQDKLLGSKRRGLGGNGKPFVASNHRIETLKQLALNNPSDQTALTYLTAFYLIDKDMNSYRELVETYYGTKVWPAMSIIQQEAVIALEEDDPKYWLMHGVSMKVQRKYELFNQDMETKQHQFNFRDLITSNYGNTYWYYFLFIK